MPESRPASRAARSSRTVLALWLDGVLLLLLLLLESPRVTGVVWHEALGLVIVVPIVWHLVLSWHWIVSRASRVFVNGTTRNRINYLINALLFVAMVVVIASGAAVSRVVLPALGVRTGGDIEWLRLHDMMSSILFIAAGLHLAMNWGWVAGVLRRRALSPEEREVNA